MGKTALLILVLSVILITAVLTILFLTDKSKSEQYRPGERSEIDAVINQAKHIYGLRKKEDTDFSQGPCLTNALMPGWVLDLVHSPRLEIDDLEENQCKSFLEGSATHFVELDLEGNLVRVR
ncbi:hypothetical protein HYW42_03610 [Candidatus Daviesbacteria bacterium]|nr:hypothetical protein [Candidatus Daviesbacteria bacterium]